MQKKENKKIDSENCEDCKDWMHDHHKYMGKRGHGGSNGAVYGLGFVGSLVYYCQQSATFSDYFFSILKSLVWPAFLVHKLFTFLGM